MKSRILSANAFTLIELLIVITIIAVLASIAYPVFTGVQERARGVQDMSNLRQIGLATQQYLNDNDGAIFSTSGDSWMKRLHPKYLTSWKIFQSPFDKRSALEHESTAPVSYGLNGNAIAGILMDKVKNTSAFILFAPAQNSSSTIAFQGVSGTGVPGVTVYKAASNPGGSAPGGTQNGRKRINALFADLHSENLTWTTFIDETSDDTAKHRWDPDGP